jgi:hypothetical protein
LKGIVMQRGDRKSIVLFNNGKIGEIPTPPNCEEGTVITVSYNKRLITLVSLLSCVVVLCAVLVLRSVYYNPVGYVQINYGNAAVELAYNSFQRILAIRPLTQQAVEPIALLSLNNTGTEAAYEKIMMSFTRSASPARVTVLVRIAQDNLAEAKKLEQSLSLLSSPLAAVSQKELTVTFELYTHELYREVMTTESQSLAIPPVEPQNGVPQMQGWRGNRGMHGGRNWWCW